MKINQRLKSLNEQQFLEVVSKPSYLLVSDAKKLLRWFGVELFVINHIEDEETTIGLIAKEANDTILCSTCT